MENMSPLLQNVVNNKVQVHDKMYEDMKTSAPEIKPEAPKAYMVKENLPQSVASYFKDNAKDIANFSHVIKTGQISDNNLGRLNDIGLKFGAMLIASFLALHSKTKQETAMRFIGGLTFLASMKLWPKLFIYLPSKLIHGVDPGEKYINAQGDKKEFWLDNQFLPWDIKGITDEQEQRRQQAVALQNRTLNMATAGFGVPLMTSFICNRLEDPVKKAISYFDLKKIQKYTKDTNTLNNYLDSARPIVKNQQKLENILKLYQNKDLDENFYYQVAKILRIDDIAEKDPDSIKTVGEFNPLTLYNDLVAQWEKDSIFTGGKEDLEKAFANLKIREENGVDIRLMNEDEMKDFIESIGDKLIGMKKDSVISYAMPKLSEEQLKELYTSSVEALDVNELKNVLMDITSDLSKQQIGKGLELAKEITGQRDVRGVFKSSINGLEKKQLTTFIDEYSDSLPEIKKKVFSIINDHEKVNGKRIFEITEALKGKIDEETATSIKDLTSSSNYLFEAKNILKKAINNLNPKDTRRALVIVMNNLEKDQVQNIAKGVVDTLTPEDCEKSFTLFFDNLKQLQINEYFKSVVSGLEEKEHIEQIFETATKGLTTEQRKQILNKLLHLKSVTVEDIINNKALGLRPSQKEEITEIVENIKMSYKDIKDAVVSYAHNSGRLNEGVKQIDKCMSNLSFDKTKFFDVLRKFNDDYVAVGRGRLKAYLKLVNPIGGRTAESIYTNAYNDYMKKLFATMDCSLEKNPLKMSLETMTKYKGQYTADFVRSHFENMVKNVEYKSQEYKDLVKKLTSIKIPKTAQDCMQKLGSEKYLARIQQLNSSDRLYKGIFAESFSSVNNIISKFISNETLNINSILPKVGVALNYETRRANGLVKINDLDIRTQPDLDTAAKELLYEGNISNISRLLQKKPLIYAKVVNAVYGEEALKAEPEIVKNYASLVRDYAYYGTIQGRKINPKEEAIISTDLVGLLKSYSVKLFNDKTWMKTFGTMAIILTSLTLLIQPFFGNVKKEFEAKNKEGGNK